MGMIADMLEELVDGGFNNLVDKGVAEGKIDAAEAAKVKASFDQFTDDAKPVLVKLLKKG